MVDAPEKIYADRGPKGGWMFRDQKMQDTEHEYIRSDIAERQIAELREKLAKAEEAWAKAASNGIADFKRAEALAAENARLRALPLKDEVERVLRDSEQRFIAIAIQVDNLSFSLAKGVCSQGEIAARSLLSRLRAGGWRHGPYGYLIKPIGLNEDHWHLATEPSAYPDEEASVPLYADQDQLPAAPKQGERS